MKRLLVFILFLSCPFLVIADPLNEEEWKRELAFMVVGLIDYGQTRDIKNHPELEERNPLLGKHPSDSRIRNYVLAAGIAHVGITYLLPREYRPYWQWGTLVVELGVVRHNHSLGLRVDF